MLNVWIGAGRLVPIADNGYIDLCLSLGVAGLALFLCVFTGAFRKAMEYLRSEPGFVALWPVTYLCIFAADNICESALLTRGTFPFLVFAIVTTSLGLSHRRAVSCCADGRFSAIHVGTESSCDLTLALGSIMSVTHISTAPATRLRDSADRLSAAGHLSHEGPLDSSQGLAVS